MASTSRVIPQRCMVADAVSPDTHSHGSTSRYQVQAQANSEKGGQQSVCRAADGAGAAWHHEISIPVVKSPVCELSKRDRRNTATAACLPGAGTLEATR